MKIFLIGYPLSGKSTIGKQIAEVMKCPYMSTGEYARSLGMKMEKSIKERDISDEFNDKIENEVWKFLKNRDCVVDGYPRSIEQAMKLLTISDKRVIYFCANPVLIADRARSRSRSDDTDDVVASRIRASMELKRVLEQYLELEVVDTGSKEDMRRLWETV